jgi:Zn-dependent protease with chaperone function
MDFFEAQELARRRTRWMVLLFGMAVLSIAGALYGVLVYVMESGLLAAKDAAPAPMVLWQPDLFFYTLAGVVVLVTCCSLFKVAQLRSGGGAVARSMGGREVEQTTKAADERMLMNIVEEMSIASGVPMPEVYILPEEGINAFAAGFTPSDAVVAVTRGCIRTLNRDELQGVVAHEFSHILNGDMRMNIRLMGVLFGILAIAVIGQLAFRSTAEASFWGGRRRSKEGGGAMLVIMALGLAVMAIGYIGVFFGRMIQSAVSRQREYLADAAAVQFTRNPDGIAGALKKIGGAPLHGTVNNAHSQEAAHFFFANALKSKGGSLFATHPPLDQRIAAIEPNWDGKFVSGARKSSRRSAVAQSSKPKAAAAKPHDFINAIGQVSAAAILSAQEIHRQIGNDLDRLHQSNDSARGVLVGLQISASDAADDAAQLQLVKGRIDGAVYRELEAWLPRLRALDLNQRFALFDAALPMAAGRDLDTLAQLSQLIYDLAHSDGEIELEEFALMRAVAGYLEDRRNPSRKVAALSPAKMEMPLCVLLSAITYTAAVEPAERDAAFKAGAKKCNRYMLKEPILLPEASITFDALEAALDLFVNLPLPQKKVIFEGALAVVLADEKVAQEELSLIRVIATSLGLPMPPLVSEVAA